MNDVTTNATDNEPRAVSLSSLAFSPAERRVLIEMRNDEQLSRADLGARLGLSKAMLSKAMAKFIDSGLVAETRDKPIKGRPGQPKLRLTLRERSVLLVGLNLSTRGCFAAVCDFTGEPIWMSAQHIIEDFAPQAIFDLAASLLSDAIAQAHATVEVGFYIPGILGPDGQIQDITPLQRAIPYVDIIDRLKERFPENAITVGQADIGFQALQPENYGKVIFHIGLADGVGGQIFDRDRPFRGGFNQAGNIGALAPATGPRPSVADLAEFLGLPITELTLEVLASLHRQNSSELFAWLDSRAPRLSMPCSAVVQLINPHKIILGGNFPASILSEIAARIDLGVFDTPDRMPLIKPEIVVSELGESRRAVAAAALPLAQFLQSAP